MAISISSIEEYDSNIIGTYDNEDVPREKREAKWFLKTQTVDVYRYARCV